MIYNVESIDRVIAKVITDLGLGQDEIPYADFIEWIADALEHIGAYYQNIEKEAHILIEDYEGHLPCDFYKPIRIKEGLEINPNIETGFYAGSLQATLAAAGIEWESLSAYDRWKIIAVPGLSKIDNMLGQVNQNLHFNKNLIGNPITNAITNKDYNINFNKITTAFRYGIIQIQYLAFPVDERGFPLVPDDVSYRDALFWKVAYHISMRSPHLLANKQMQDLEYCRQMWNKYCVQARASANMPDLDMLIRLKNNWLRLVNDPHFDRTWFRENGTQDNTILDRR